MNCPYCGDEIPEYSNLDFHVNTEHGFSVPAQYTQDTITRSMKDPDFDKIESYEYTQKQLEDAKNWWEKAKLPHETEKWKEMRIGDRQRIIGRYADYMYKKYVVGKEGQRDLKPTGKNHGIDFYTDLALDDYMNNTYHTPEEYENALYGVDKESYSAEDTAMKRYGVPRNLPNGEEIVDSTYGTELHAKDWWDSKTVKNEKGDGKSRKWDDLDSEERKTIRKLFNDDVREEYLVDEAVGLSRDWDEDEKEFSKHVDQDILFRDDDTGFYKDVPSGGEPWQEGGESEATEGGFGSGRKGHSAWMRDMEFGGNYKVCPNCNVNTSFENNKCLICGN